MLSRAKRRWSTPSNGFVERSRRHSEAAQRIAWRRYALPSITEQWFVRGNWLVEEELMKVESIVIILQPETDSEHATELKFERGMWSTNGPVYPRISAAMRDIVTVLTGRQPKVY
jgi:hypothetical protein